MQPRDAEGHRDAVDHRIISGLFPHIRARGSPGTEKWEQSSVGVCVSAGGCASVLHRLCPDLLCLPKLLLPPAAVNQRCCFHKVASAGPAGA